MTVTERLAALRSLMKERGIDAWLAPTDDFHSSEYVGEHFACRRFITGFTGSAGTAVIMADQAGLWTDGRYFLQAQRQLEGSGITLYKMGEEGVPTIEEFLENELQAGQVLGYDGRTVTAAKGKTYRERLSAKDVRIDAMQDLIGEIWTDRPALSAEPVWELDTAYTGRSRAEKLADVREKMLAKKAAALLITSLDDIAWLTNLRGNDVECNPVFLSYLLLQEKDAALYAQEQAFPDTVREALACDGITLRPYAQLYEDLPQLKTEGALMIDPNVVNDCLFHLIPENIRVLENANPTILLKAVKNQTERENMRIAHIRDGAAVTRFIYWLKHSVGKEPIDELSAAEKLESFRSMQENYLGPSFSPIIAYAEHGAIIHYASTPETNVPVLPAHMLLADTGGQYMEGTTDITRTIVMGETTQEEKEFFTRVLRGHLNLGAACFPHGTVGSNLDCLARGPLWEIGENYNHGTGHGVGYLLNVHEGPQRINYKVAPGTTEAVLEEGMITSDEPGYYRAGQFGIRHENLTLCVKAEKEGDGRFLTFEPLTMVPFDLDAVLPEMMSERERALLNAYHKKVREAISPLLPPEEAAWLEEATREIH